ncbi:unnamed protein product [Lactuca virosa]|uniref:Uncharacterized protein n=1 Tax=Lactuca virosa TaxID=75947 RepID=A0AAU9PVB3_9ASTR|nr:unnamed protein product [Lactuca virosa]
MIGVFSLAAHARPSSSVCLHHSGQLTSPPMSFLTLLSSDIEFSVLSLYVAADDLFLLTCPNEIHGFDSSYFDSTFVVNRYKCNRKYDGFDLKENIK